ncbi:MAG: hypothetical protein GMKNLPBB_00102 [Myxococcota bacterium]|nr:hypothetical protein [Myxococcota bacterium]
MRFDRDPSGAGAARGYQSVFRGLLLGAAFVLPWNLVLTEIFCGLMAVAALAGLAAGTVRPRWTGWHSLIAVWMLVNALSLLENSWIPLNGDRMWFWGMAAFPVCFIAFDHARLPLRWLLIAGGIPAALLSAYAIFQHFTGADWFRPAGLEIRSPLPLFPGWYRATGAFNMQTTLAFAWLFPLGAALSLALQAERRKTRSLAGAMALLLVAAIAAAHVRAVMLGLAVMVVTLILARAGRKTRAVGLAGLLGAAVWALMELEGVHLLDRLSRDDNLDRIFMWKNAFSMAAEHGGAGIGAGAFTPLTRVWYDDLAPGFPVRCHAHNNFLHVFTETGAAGLLCLIALFAAAVWRFFPARGPESHPAAAGLGLSMLAFAAGALTQDPLYDGEVAFTLWFYLAFAASSRPQPGMDIE